MEELRAIYNIRLSRAAPSICRPGYVQTFLGSNRAGILCGCVYQTVRIEGPSC